MQVSVENTGALGRRLKVSVPASQVEAAYSDRLQRLARQVKMPGFRPGKVPTKVVEQQYGPRLMEEVVGDLIQTSFREAVGQEGLRPAGGPRIEPKSLQRGQEFSYTAEFEVYPEIRDVSLDGVSIERPTVEVGDDDVARTLETIRRQRTRWNPVDRPAQSADRVRLDFVGRLGAEPFEGGTARDFTLVIGSGTLLDDMERGLIGAKAGETRTLPVSFPADYRHPKLAGQKAEFDVTVHEVAEPVLPALDETLARELGVADGSLDKLRHDIRANLEREAAKRVNLLLRVRVLKALHGKYPLDLPKALVDAEIQTIKTRDAGMTGQVPAASDADDRYRSRAAQRVALGLLLAEAMRSMGVKVDAQAVRARIEDMAAEYESPQEFIQWHYQQPGRLGEVESMVAEERAVTELLATARVVDAPVAFQDLLKLNESF
jgi:trigger factor